MIQKVLLVYPPLPMTERYGKGLKDIGTALPPLGLLYIGAVLEKAGYQVKIHDSDLLNSDLNDVLIIVKEFQPDFIGIYCNTSNYHRVINYADNIKKIYPMPICLGGPHPIIEPAAVLANPSIDLVVMGEGEITIIELLDCLSNNKDLKGIKGCAYKTAGEIIINPPRELIQDLDLLPLPARHLVPIGKYRPSPHQYLRLPMTTMITSRGCPFGCLFCASRNVWGRRYRMLSVDKVIKEIKFLKEHYQIKNIIFWDDLWGFDRKWTEEFCHRMIDEKMNISWSCERRVDTVDLEILKLMKAAGCYSIFYGVESLDQDCLNAINKGIRVEQAEQVLKLTKKVGIEVRANFILGLPKETPTKVRVMVKKIIKLNPDYVKFNILTPYPGTPLYQELISNNSWGIFNKDYDRSTGYFANFLPSSYRSFAELVKTRKYVFWKFYLRPRYIVRKIFKIRSWNDLKKYWNGFRAVIKM